MRKQIIILYIGLSVCMAGIQQQLKAQDISRHSAFFELGGNAIIFSLNYDYIPIVLNYFKTAITFGGSPVGITPQINFLFGGSLSAEIGFGYTIDIKPYFSTQYGQPYNYESYRIGFRYQPNHRGILFRLAFTPIRIARTRYDYPVPWFGISLGYTFGKKK